MSAVELCFCGVPVEWLHRFGPATATYADYIMGASAPDRLKKERVREVWDDWCHFKARRWA